MVERWYVYAVYSCGYLLYIGKGTGYRLLVSARRLNGIAGVLEYFKSEKRALDFERKMIAQFKPVMNIKAGGGGSSKLRQYREAAGNRAFASYWKRDRKQTFENADKYPNYWTKLFAAAIARSDLNSKGIKGPEWQRVAQEQALADPVVAEALKRLTDWLPLKQPALPLWITS